MPARLAEPGLRHHSPNWLSLVRAFCSNSRAMTKWKYRIVRTKSENVITIGKLVVDNTDEELKGHTLDSAFSILGEEGWELTGSSMPWNDKHIFPWFVFKRPLG
ncbi:MAG TPA: hypothetical protein QF772_04925 [Nitrospinaceae bacterium]|nr:hypothetical protein [Nitrospinaceae bacterium]